LLCRRGFRPDRREPYLGYGRLPARLLLRWSADRSYIDPPRTHGRPFAEAGSSVSVV
jgi:hypothetical protein